MRPVLPALLLLALAEAASAQTMRDPMRPAGAAPVQARAPAQASLRLEGVINGAERVAIVSGRVVRAGDVVLGATILEVLSNGVRLSRAGRVQSLLLPAEPVIGAVRVVRSYEAKASEAKKP